MVQTKKRWSGCSKKQRRPRLVADTVPEIKDWLKRAAGWETERLRAGVRREVGEGLVDIGQLKVTESHVIRRAVERELLKIEMEGGPGPNPDSDSS
jgi:hypothetical protein